MTSKKRNRLAILLSSCLLSLVALWIVAPSLHAYCLEEEKSEMHAKVAHEDSSCILCAYFHLTSESFCLNDNSLAPVLLLIAIIAWGYFSVFKPKSARCFSCRAPPALIF